MVRPHLHAVPHRPLPEGYVLRVLEPTDESQLARLLTLAFADTWDVPRVAAALTQAPDVKLFTVYFRVASLWDGLEPTPSGPRP